MKSILSNPYLLLFSRVFLGCVFIFASIEKISSPEGFASSVEAYKMIPYSLINIFALIVPWLELLCGIFLVVGIASRASALVLSVLLIAFIAGIVLAILRGLNIDCGCFGSAHSSPVGWMKVIEDCGLVMLCALTAGFPKSRLSLENVLSKT